MALNDISLLFLILAAIAFVIGRLRDWYCLLRGHEMQQMDFASNGDGTIHEYRRCVRFSKCGHSDLVDRVPTIEERKLIADYRREPQHDEAKNG